MRENQTGRPACEHAERRRRNATHYSDIRRRDVLAFSCALEVPKSTTSVWRNLFRFIRFLIPVPGQCLEQLDRIYHLRDMRREVRS